MKSHFLYLTVEVLLCIGILSSCSKDDETGIRSFPRVSTISITDVTSNSATFLGEIYFIADEEIIEHGFNLSTISMGTPDLSERFYKGSMSGVGKFTQTITKNFIKGKVYYVRAFAKTNNYFVFGEERTFIYK